ncbi:MAG: tail fiber domain-containing protein [Bacteroidales bacterium]|nr:tail fiber domain-containing protein [Bacteroidales bacterium]
MKKLTLTLTIVILSIVSIFAQAPQSFKYQAVVRDNTGEILTNQAVSLRISIHDGSAGGTVIYRETHSATTNLFGLVNIEIGNETPDIGTFSAILWGSGSKYLETELDPDNGTNYTSMGTAQLMSVPYALFSENTANTNKISDTDGDTWVDTEQTYDNDNIRFVTGGTERARILPNGNVGIGTNTPGCKMDVRGDTYIDGDLELRSDVSAGSVFGGRVNLGTHSYIDFFPVNDNQRQMRFKVNAYYSEMLFNILDGGGNEKEMKFKDGKLCVGDVLDYIELGHDGNYANINWEGDGSLDFEYNSSNLVSINQNGRVGIGTTTPAAMLHLDGGSHYKIRLEAEDIDEDNQITSYNDEGHRMWILNMLDYSDDNNFRIWSEEVAHYVFSMGYENGNVCIGTGNPSNSYKLTCEGDACEPGGGSWSSWSDKNLKDINSNFNHGLKELLQLSPVVYNYKQDNELNLPSEKEYIGLIAQEVQKVIPEAVEKIESGYLAINNDPIIWTMLNAIKEQQKEIEELKEIISNLDD